MATNKIIRIALADDVSIFRKGLMLCINLYKDCAVDIEAEDGIDMIEKIELASVLPDVCILDISMPRMDGYETLKKIKGTWPHMKVIMLSMHYNEYSIIKSFRDGASACLPKDVDIEELHEAIIKSYNVGLYHSELTMEHINNTLLNKCIDTELTDKELIFLRLSCQDISYKQIAEIMKVSHRTVDTYRDNLFKKLRVNSRPALVVFALKTGISPTIRTNT